MYPYLRDLFVHFLGYSAKEVLVDTSNDAGDVPDLAILAPTGISDAKGQERSSRWLVLEAKDETGIFLNPISRRKIFDAKSKYIELDTCWFVFVDPACLVLRKVTSRSASYDEAQDVELRWDALDEISFKTQCAVIARDQAGTSSRLVAFRAGDVTHLAEIRLTPSTKDPLPEAETVRYERARNEFYQALRESAVLLRAGCQHALAGLDATELVPLGERLDAFHAKYGTYHLQLEPFQLKADAISGFQNTRQHHRDVRDLQIAIRGKRRVARLALFTLPRYLARARDNGNSRRKNALGLLALESASLLLARCIMLRFLEDHRFFGETKFLCNGGVHAFHEMARVYGAGYTRLLRDAYGEGSRFDDFAFGEDELDWVLDNHDPQLSNAIERVLFYLSHFDFATIEQDVLSEIYGQFLDTAERKAFGEHYTPPDIARYVVGRLGLKPGDRVLDPACGLGTFLIEAYQVLAGNAAARGVGTFADAVKALELVRGNDLNRFSAMIAQLQMLWHLFRFREDILKTGFPETNILGGYDSLAAPTHELDASINEFGLIDERDYAAVVGNPPYVRPERATREPSLAESKYFADIASGSDLYSRFLYKALMSWCRPASEGLAAGKVGFVLPLSFCDNDDNARLRELFRPGRRWRILEIVDLEQIGPFVFAADVVPIVLVVQASPAAEDDPVRLSTADERCAHVTGIDERHLAFHLEDAPSCVVAAKDIFTSDGRILTRITPKRLAVLKRFEGQTFGSVVHRIWVAKRGAAIHHWAREQPAMVDEFRWEPKELIGMGAAFRGSEHTKPGGFRVFKGENIAACALVGEPVKTQIDVDRMDDASFWRFRDILPATGYAFHQIATALTAAPFHPATEVLLNTASLFFPAERFADVPFDLLVQSRIYQWFFGVSQREGVLFRARCHVYPTTVRRLPWTDDIVPHSVTLHGLRDRFLLTCQEQYKRLEALAERLQSAPHTNLHDVVTRHANARVDWSSELNAGKEITVRDPGLHAHDGAWMVRPTDDLADWIAITDRTVAEALLDGLRLQAGREIRRSEILSIPIPEPLTVAAWRADVDAFDLEDRQNSRNAILDEVDEIVARAFGLTQTELAFIHRDLVDDPCLRRIRPNLPFTERALRGMRTALTSSTRYDEAYTTRG